jgi:hypothetical protein
MSLYNNPSPLEINDAVGENLRKFRQEVDIYFIATGAYEKPVKVQVARLLNLLGPEALKVYNTFNREANVCRTNHQNQFGRNGKPVNEIVYDLDTVYDSLSIEWGGHERAKVWKTPKNTYVESEGNGTNFAWVTGDNIIIISMYSSPNEPISVLENTLEEIGTKVRSFTGEAVIGGDFNAKSPLWNETRTDPRGIVVAEWIAKENLIIQNQGYVPNLKPEAVNP